MMNVSDVENLRVIFSDYVNLLQQHLRVLALCIFMYLRNKNIYKKAMQCIMHERDFFSRTFFFAQEIGESICMCLV